MCSSGIDAFGQNYASTTRFDDESNMEDVLYEAKKYYANIIMCYGKQAKAAWDIVKTLEIELIAPGHGVIWRSHIDTIMAAYEEWSSREPDNGAVIVYDSMWHSTEKMARVISEALADMGIMNKLFDLKSNHHSNIMPDILTNKFVFVGSPTLNNQMLPNVAAFLTYLKGLTPRERKAYAFGSYGWGGQSIGLIEKELEACGFELLGEGYKQQYIPTQEELNTLFQKIQEMMSDGKKDR